MKLTISAVLLAGMCATVQSIDKPTTQLPDGLARCSQPVGEPIKDGPAPECGADDAQCTETAAIGRECLDTLKSEVGGATGQGTLVFGLNSDDSGNVTEICFYGGTLGEVPRTLACLAEKARGKRFNIVPEAQETKWTVRYQLE